MSTFMDRLLVEETELLEKQAKLQTFIRSDGFKTINTAQQSLLKIQISAMNTYLTCLNERIILINNETPITNN